LTIWDPQSDIAVVPVDGEFDGLGSRFCSGGGRRTHRHGSGRAEYADEARAALALLLPVGRRGAA